MNRHRNRCPPALTTVAAVCICTILSPRHALDAQTRMIMGTVSDATTGQPVVGAAVAGAGARRSAFTNEDGNFSIAVAPGAVTLEITMLGYQSASVVISADADHVDVALRMDILKLDEIVVTGQATGVSRRNLANAVASVSGRELDRVPAASVEQALRGKVAGADIQSNSGAPGGGMQLQLRGVSTILGNHRPLYVVDGVIVSDQTIPSGVHAVTGSSSNPVRGGSQDNSANRISDLNPYDVESIEILKGASAAAIYGSKANNGVIVIRTKRGRVGAPRFNVTQRFGFFQLANKLGLRKFTSMEEAVEFFGPQAADHWAPGKFFDHEELLAGRTPLSHETAASVAGGTEDTRYYASGLVKHDGGIIDNTFYNKESIKLNIDQALGDKASFSLSTNAVHTLAGRGITNNDNRSISYYMTLPSSPSFVDLRAVPRLRRRPAGRAAVQQAVLAGVRMGPYLDRHEPLRQAVGDPRARPAQRRSAPARRDAVSAERVPSPGARRSGGCKLQSGFVP